MAININSPEFAAAWRLVSEALLAHIQGGYAISVDGISPDCVKDTSSRKNNQSDEEPTHVKPPQERKVEAELYAACPIKQSSGSYIFKNLKDERQDGSTFKITRYNDGSCEFELCDLEGEQRQIFKDNQADWMPSAVGTSIGEITADNAIVKIKPGIGCVDGRSVRIIEPLQVEFK